MKIGEHIKEIRISKGYTQTELSERSGIAVRTIQRIENSEVTPSIYSLNAIGAALDVKLNEVPMDANGGKFEFKIVISNFSNLFVDIKTLIKRNWKTLLVIVTVTFGLLSFKDLKSLFFNLTDNSIVFSAQIPSSFEPKKITIQDNVERYLFDYTQTDELGFNKMHAPINWTEPIIEAAFDIRGIVLSGTLGLEFKEGIELIEINRGFIIPKGKRVRIFNGGKDELILIEILQPAYDLKRVKQFNSFD